jgi:hypothetical protein
MTFRRVEKSIIGKVHFQLFFETTLPCLRAFVLISVCYKMVFKPCFFLRFHPYLNHCAIFFFFRFQNAPYLLWTMLILFLDGVLQLIV